MVRILCPGFGSTGTGSTVGASIRRRKLRPGEGTRSTQAPRLFCLDGTTARADLQVGLKDPDPLSGRQVDGQGFDGGWPDSGDSVQPVARVTNLSSERCTPNSL